MTKYNAHGVDLDWEFPCSPERKNPVRRKLPDKNAFLEHANMQMGENPQSFDESLLYKWHILARSTCALTSAQCYSLGQNLVQ